MVELEKQSRRCPLKIGQVIAGRYSIRGVLGAGSIGWVVKVADEALSGELVALKVIFPHLCRDEETLARLRREVSITRQLAHPAIVHLHDFEENPDGDTFLAMEYVRGIDLQELLTERNGRGLPFDEGLLILTRVAEALLHAHQHGIVHRDLKPSNILIGHDGTVRVCDFGLAKSFQTELGLTRTGESLGTPSYMAPEQFRAEDVDQRTDVYSFGVLAFTLVTGQPPFAGDDYFRLAESHLNEPLPPMRSRGKPVPEWFDELVRRCCAKHRGDRPLSAADFLPLLQQELPGGGRVDISVRRGKGHRRMSGRARWAAAVVFWLVIFVGGFHAAYAQYPFKRFVIGEILQAELQAGREFILLRHLLGLRASLVHPESAFALLHESKGNGIEDAAERSKKYELAALIELDMDIRGKLRIAGPPISALTDSAGYTLLQRAVRTRNRDLVNLFQSYPTGNEQLDPEGETVLTYALGTADLLLLGSVFAFSHLAVNTPNSAGDTPLHIAIRDGNTIATRALLKDHNANPSIKDRQGNTPLHLAIQGRSPDVLKILVDLDLDFDVRDSEGRTPLMRAAMNSPSLPDTISTIRTLLLSSKSIRATINSRDNYAATALILAVQQSSKAVAILLFRNGADPFARDSTGKSALDYAKALGLKELVIEFNGGTGALAQPSDAEHRK